MVNGLNKENLNHDYGMVKIQTCFFQPPKVRCTTRIWHPNITEDGEVCLSLLRHNSLDSMGMYWRHIFVIIITMF